MKILIIISFIIFSFVGTVHSYPESKMNDCIESALSNPAYKSKSKSKIKDYCDCALNAIIDENKNIRLSGYECAQQNFN